MSAVPLPSGDSFAGLFSLLLMDDQGRFVRRQSTGAETPVPAQELPDYLYEKIVLPKGVTDVFIWVHGWQTDRPSAVANARRMFHAIGWSYERLGAAYPRLEGFTPGFVAVSWPSTSTSGPSGYRKIRDRAKAMTDDGYAEFFLASLLGYLSPSDLNAGGEAPRTLRSSRGFYVHCLGHSFGGRFLTAAIRAAANPQSKRTLSLLAEVLAPRRKVLSGTSAAEGFAFEVDSCIVFQMAAPNRGFGEELRPLVTKGPLRGPLVVTYSGSDRANCLWHRFTEGGQQAIGCTGANQPIDRIKRIKLLRSDSPYVSGTFPARTVVNVDANWLYRHYGWFQPEGAHSDFWYDDSVHLVLSVADASRSPTGSSSLSASETRG
jgi:hypothetical protein